MMTEGSFCPENLKKSMRLYAEQHIPCGDFLRCILAGDLFEAVARADEFNRQMIPEIACFAFNQLPPRCRGSWDLVEKWEAAIPVQPE